MAGSKRDGFASLAGRKVLIVEDEAVAALYLAGLVRDLGCVVVGPAQALGEAMALARGELLDAAMLDLNLRGEAAWPVADELHSRNVPFVILSGYAELDVGRETGALVILAKPVAPEQVAAALAACIGRNQS